METLAEKLFPTTSAPVGSLDLRNLHESHGNFVWASLQRLGARRSDLDDLSQETWLAVHKRLHTYDRAQPLRPWLFGICMRILANHRRLAWVRRVRATDELPEPVAATASPESPESAAIRSQARARLATILDGLDMDKRAVFVMFEVERLSCEEIADSIGIPVGTVYSRLSAARKAFEAAARRFARRDAKDGGT